MPYGSRSRLRLDFEVTNQAINFSHQFRLFSANLINIDYAVDTGRSDERAAGVERKMFGGFWQIAEIEHLKSIGDVDNLYGEFASRPSVSHPSKCLIACLLAGHSSPLPIW